VKAQSGAGKPILLKRPEEFEQILRSTKVDAGLLIAPDEMQPKIPGNPGEEHSEPGL